MKHYHSIRLPFSSFSTIFEQNDRMQGTEIPPKVAKAGTEKKIKKINMNRLTLKMAFKLKVSAAFCQWFEKFPPNTTTNPYRLDALVTHTLLKENQYFYQ